MQNNKKHLFSAIALIAICSLLILPALIFSTDNAGAKEKKLENFQVKKSDFKKNKKAFVEDQIIVKYKNDKKPFRVINLPKGASVLEEVEKYKEKKDVEFAEPNYFVYADMVPNDPYYSPYQWHMDNNMDDDKGSGINAEEAWDISTGAGVVIAVIDTGIAMNAPDFAGTCFEDGYDFINDDNDPSDDEGHGTHVAGTIAQATNNIDSNGNYVGAAGVAHSACLMPIKALGKNGDGTDLTVANAIYFAITKEADVINLSLGSEHSSDTLQNAILAAHNAGIIVVAAAGNDGENVAHYPASYDSVISVGATGYNKTLASYSNYGPDIDVVAPGGEMYLYNRAGRVKGILDLNNDNNPDGVLQQTLDPEGGFNYFWYQGTSMASPHVAGAAALLIANKNATTTADVREALQSTAQDLGAAGRDDIYGYGLIDAYAALQWMSEAACIEDSDCSADGWFYTGETQWILIGQCTEKEQKEQEYKNYYCDAVLDCQYDITDIRWIDTGVERPKIDGTLCSTGICCAGICTAVCLVDSDCDGENESCYNPGTCEAVCEYTNIFDPICGNKDCEEGENWYNCPRDCKR